MAKIKYLVTTPKRIMHEEITMALNSENSFYNSIQNLVSFLSCLPIYRLNFAELQFCLLFCVGVKFCLSFWAVKVSRIRWWAGHTARNWDGGCGSDQDMHARSFTFLSLLSWLDRILEQGRISAQEILLIFMNKLNIIHFPCNYITVTKVQYQRVAKHLFIIN